MKTDSQNPWLDQRPSPDHNPIHSGSFDCLPILDPGKAIAVPPKMDSIGTPVHDEIAIGTASSGHISVECYGRVLHFGFVRSKGGGALLDVRPIGETSVPLLACSTVKLNMDTINKRYIGSRTEVYERFMV
jgi:hypothetical protein